MVSNQVWVTHHLCLQALEEQISLEESSSHALREEVLAKEQKVSELHTAMKEVRLTCCVFIRNEKLTSMTFR